MRVLMSMSSENISRNPPTFSHTRREKPMLNVRGTNFCVSLNDEWAASGPPKQSVGLSSNALRSVAM